MKKVIILGKGELGIKICKWFYKNQKYKIYAIIPVIPEPKWTNSILKWAKNNNQYIIESGNYNDLKFDNIDLAISIFYDKIINIGFINKCKKIINLHNSPLPKYRGVSPINWALKDRCREHGVTIHEITPGIDDGPIISQIKYSIYPEFEEVEDVYHKAINYGYVLFKNTIPIIDKIIATNQVDNDSSYHSSADNLLLGDRRYFTKSVSNKINKSKKT